MSCESACRQRHHPYLQVVGEGAAAAAPWPLPTPDLHGQERLKETMQELMLQPPALVPVVVVLLLMLAAVTMMGRVTHSHGCRAGDEVFGVASIRPIPSPIEWQNPCPVDVVVDCWGDYRATTCIARLCQRQVDAVGASWGHLYRACDDVICFWRRHMKERVDYRRLLHSTETL